MEDSRRGGGVGRHDLKLASRKAEEAALRRFQATHWLECVMGPLGISCQPSEKAFISCLRNGLILCNLINKIYPGSVPKVVEKQSSLHSMLWDSQPLPAYQYFENVRNVLVAVEELNLPVFDASIFERENLEEGSSAKVVDCILALKAYQEWKQMPGNIEFHKPPRSPFIVHSSCRANTRTQGTAKSDSCRQLDMSSNSDKKLPVETRDQKLQDSIIKALADRMVDAKENMDYNLRTSLCNRNMDRNKLFREVLPTFSEEQLHKQFPELKSENVNPEKESSSPTGDEISKLLQNLSSPVNGKCCRACLSKGFCKHWDLVQGHEKELLNLKVLLSSTKKEFVQLQTQLQSDLKQLGRQVQEMSFSAQKYYKVVEENRNLYNMVQDLNGNVRVYCRIRPLLRAETISVVDFIGEDGSLVVVDPLKSLKDGRKVFKFNHIFGPTSSQEDVFAETRQLIRSIMDGYNVCIFAYGQTGSGKTYTMCGPSGDTTMELGINYLALNELFQLSAKRKDIMEYDMHVQMVEIYNEQVRDLLTDDSSVRNLEIRSCLSENDIALPDASMHQVTCTSDVINLMKLGEMNRAVGSTAMNSQSSRSHSVLTIHVNGEDDSGNRLHSCLHLVDLAGSERIDKSEVTGEGLKEALHINKSLSSLGDVIMSLAQKNAHIPYRNSKLTLLLQSALGGHAKTLMIAHVSPEADSFGETISTLKFAQRVSTVELGAACANKGRSEVLELKAQIESLKKTLASKEASTPLPKKPKEAVRTPLAEANIPRSRRLSIENCITSNVENLNLEDRKGPKTPLMQPQSRRLSLEGPRFARKDPEQIMFIDSMSKPVPLQSTNEQELTKREDADSLTMPLGDAGSNGDSVADLKQENVPKSPIKRASKDPLAKIDNRTRNLHLPQPKTPEPVLTSKNVGEKGIKTQNGIPSEVIIPASNSTAHGKGSQIRKSLRSIGKLINGSEKRNQQKLQAAVTLSPLSGSSNIFEEKSPTPTNSRALRRQSLTSLPPPERSSGRSSLTGNHPIPSTNSNEKRNSRTPLPVVRASNNLARRWM